MEQTSRLSIVIGTGNAQRDLQNLRRALTDLDGASGRAVGGVQRLDGSLQSISRGFGVLKVAIGALGLGMTVGSIISTADSMQTLNNQLRLATGSAEKFGIAMESVERIAMENKVSLQSVGEMYVSNERALKQLGKGQQEVLRFTENVTKAMAVGGGSAEGQAAALTQLGQALASGVLRGDEFNSIAEQAPMIMTLLSESLNVTTGELRKMAAEGKLTSEVVYKALTNAEASEKLKSMSGATATTVSQAMQRVSNQWELAVNKIMNGEGGISQSLASMISGFAGVIPKVLEFGEAFTQSENVKIIIDGIKEGMVFVFGVIQNGTQFVLDNAEAFTALASGIGASALAFLAIKAGMATVALLSTAIGVLTGVAGAFGAVMAVITSPITLAVVAIGALVAACVYLYRNFDEVKAKATEVFNSLPAPVKEMAQNIKSTFETLISFLSKAFDFMAPIWSAQFSLIRIIATSAFDFIRGYINTWVATTKAVFIAGVNIFATVFNTGFNLIKNTFTTTFNAINALVRGDMDGVKKAIGDGIKNAVNIVKDGVKNILSAFTNLGSQLMRVGRDAVQGFINGVKAKMGEALNTAREMANKVVSTVKSALDIHSPSRVMREIGAWAGEGFVLGVGDKVKDAKQVAENLANALTSTVADLHRQNFMLKNHANPLADLEYKLQFGELAELTDKQKERVLELARANLDLAKSNDTNKSISNEIDGIYEKIQTRGMNRIQLLEWQIENTNKYAGASANLIEQLKEQIKHEETLNQLVSAKSKRDGYQGERDKNSYLYRNKTDKYASDRWDLSNQGFDAGQVAEILGMKQQADLMAAMAKMPKSLTMPTLQNNNLGSAVSSAVGGYTDLKTQLDNNLKIIQESLDAGLISEQEAYNERLAQEQAFQEARQNLILSGGENVAKTLADSAKSILGANSKMYHALFAVEKGFAIARSVVAIQQAIALASANPFPLNLAAMATVAAQTASIIGNIKSVAMPVGQAHDGIMSVPKSGTWNLEKGERVLPKHTAQSLDKKLDGMGNDGRAVNITVHNYSGEPTKVETDQNGDIRLIVGQELNKQLPQHVNNPNSEFNKSLKNNYQLQRRL